MGEGPFNHLHAVGNIVVVVVVVVVVDNDVVVVVVVMELGCFAGGHTAAVDGVGELS